MLNDVNQRNFPDPRMDPWDYQGQLAGYKNGDEFKKEYFNQAKKAVIVGTAAGTGVFAGAFGLSAGTVAGAGEIPAILGVAIRFGSRALQVAKNVGVQAWNAAKSAYASLSGAAATPQGQEVLKNTVECVGALVDESPPPVPATTLHAKCYLATRAKDFLKETFSDESATKKGDL